jgi:hypothetical protein
VEPVDAPGGSDPKMSALTGTDQRRDFGARDVLTSAGRAAREDWKRILVTTIVVFGIITLFEFAVRALEHSGASWLQAVLDLAVSALDVASVAFMIGLLVAFVGGSQHGRRKVSVGTVLRKLPYRRLITADLLMTAMVAAGLLLFVVPGIVVFTLLCVAGPVIEIERLPVLTALHRSMSLVLRRFWLVGLLVTVPTFLGDIAVSAAVDAARNVHPVVVFVATAFGNAVVDVVSALFAVEIAFRLIEGETS